MRLIVFASRKDKIYQLIVSTTVADGMAAAARASACVVFAWFSQGLKRCLNDSIFLYPLYPMLWFYVKAVHCPPPTIMVLIKCLNSKTTWWIVFKFGTHTGSDSALNLLNSQGQGHSVTNSFFFFFIFECVFLTIFLSYMKLRGHRNTRWFIHPSVHLFVHHVFRFLIAPSHYLN